MPVNLKQFAESPLSFFDGLTVPSAFGNKAFNEIMADHQREWFEAIAPSMVSVSKGEKPGIGRFWSERTKGGSKDSDIACVLLWLLAFSKQSLEMQVGAADRDQANELRKAARDILNLNQWLTQRIEVNNYSLQCRATRCECTIVATDVAGSHGARPDIVVMNELSHVTKEEFASNLLDNATKRPNGIVIVATNAGFTGTWQEQWRKVAQASSRWNFHCLAEPAPWLSPEEVDEAKRRNSISRFNRLFYGVWSSGSGDALDPDDINQAVREDLRPFREAAQDWKYVVGVDLGIKHDHSGIVVLGVNRHTQKIRLAATRRFRPELNESGKRSVDLMQVENCIVSIHRKFRPRVIAYDPWQAALMATRCSHRGCRMSEVPFTGANLNLMATTMLEVFQSRRIEMYPEPDLIRDLQRLTIVEKSYGHRLESTRDANGHADLATALAIALPVATQRLSKTKVFGGVLGAMASETPYERHLREQRELNTPEDPQEKWKELMNILNTRRTTHAIY